MIIKTVILLFILTITNIVFCQENRKIDSISSLINRTNNDTSKVNLYIKLYSHFIDNDLFKAKLYVDSASLFAQKSNDPNKLAIVDFAYGYIYFYKGNNNLALEYFIKYLKYCELNIRKYGLSDVLLNIGGIHYAQNNFETALEYYNRALNLMNELEKENPKIISNKQIVLNNIAIIYKEKKLYGKALEYFKKSLGISLKIKDYNNAGNVCNNLGDLFQILNLPDSGLFYINKGLEFRTNINDKIGITRSYLNLAQYYFRKNNLKLALENAINARINIENTGDRYTAYDVYQVLSEVYEKTNDYKNAFEAHKQLKIVSDSLYNERVTREITKKEMEYEFDKREKQTQIEQQQKETRYIILASVLAILLLIIISLYFAAHAREKRISLESKNLTLEKQNLELEKTNLQQQIDFKDKELATNVIYLLKKNEFITNIAEKLLKSQQIVNKEAQELIQSVIKDMESNVDDTIWNEFEVRFQQVHKEFYERLNAVHPNLTPNEKKICAFLKLNMTTKDISSITFQSVSSIVTARSRLRKKMGIDRDENLITYLQQL